MHEILTCLWYIYRLPTKIAVDKESITNINSNAENFNKFFHWNWSKSS